MLYANDAVIACPDRAAKSAVVVVYAHDEVMAYDELIAGLPGAYDADTELFAQLDVIGYVEPVVSVEPPPFNAYEAVVEKLEVTVMLDALAQDALKATCGVPSMLDALTYDAVVELGANDAVKALLAQLAVPAKNDAVTLLALMLPAT